MHLILSCTAGSFQSPQDARVTQNHPGKRCQDLTREHLLKVWEASHSLSSRIGKGEAEHQDREAQPVLDVLELPKLNRQEHGHKAIQADAGQKQGAAGVFHAVGELEGGPHPLALPVVKVNEVEGGHAAEVEIHEGQAAKEHVRSGGFFALVDEDCEDK